MSNKLKKQENEPIDQPFAPPILKQAKKIVGRYKIVIGKEDDGYYLGHCVEMPLTFGGGKTPNQCIDDVTKAMITGVAYMIEEGQTPPLPANVQKRTEQVNVRLTIQEKNQIANAAKSHGYRSISDYLRESAKKVAAM